MMTRWLTLALLPAALLPLLLRADAAKESAAFFDAGKVIHVDITIDKKEMESLRRERASGRGGLARGIENRYRHGSTLLVTGVDPMSPATQPP